MKPGANLFQKRGGGVLPESFAGLKLIKKDLDPSSVQSLSVTMTHSTPTDMKTWALCDNCCEWRNITNDELVNEEFLCSNIQLHCLPTKNQFIGFQFFKKFQDYLVRVVAGFCGPLQHRRQ
jgi:hypothetical protein